MEHSESLSVSDGVHSGQNSRRIELLEVLDRVVTYEHYYHSVYGHFTKTLGKIGYKLPREVTDFYDVRIGEAGADQLLVTAFYELNGKLTEIISVNQDYQVHSSIDLPSPSAEYLKAQAYKHLRMLKELPKGQVMTEQGIFKGYFQYSFQEDSNNQRVVFAEGIRFPVQGVRLDSFEGANESLKEGELLGSASGGQMGQLDNLNESNLAEETYLAQKIFLGETGRYAKNWTELSKIVHFRFEGKDQWVGREDLSSPFLGSQIAQRRTPAVQGDRKIPNSSKKALEIEAISTSSPW